MKKPGMATHHCDLSAVLGEEWATLWSLMSGTIRPAPKICFNGKTALKVDLSLLSFSN